MFRQMLFGQNFDGLPVFCARILKEFGDHRLQLVLGRSGTGQCEFRLQHFREKFKTT